MPAELSLCALATTPIVSNDAKICQSFIVAPACGDPLPAHEVARCTRKADRLRHYMDDDGDEASRAWCFFLD
jgi:hypothetical protein